MKGLNLLRYFTSADEDLPQAYLKRCLKYLDNLYGIKHHNKKEKNEKIHNRSQPRVDSAAVDDWPGIKDHEQQLGEVWPPDRDQRPEASSSKPQGAPAQAASFKPQA